MRKNDLIIRLEKKEDYRMVENLVREAFCIKKEQKVINKILEDIYETGAVCCHYALY